MASKGTVLVTGANGYIAARTVEAFLKAGYSVRGTVRSLASATEVKEALPEYADKLSFVEVPDITVPGAFDDAAKGIDAVAHLASPVSFDFTDPEPVIRSAVDGTLRVLESSLKEPRIKNFVFMSSVVAMVQQPLEGHTHTEADWNTWAEDVVAEQGKNTPGRIIYIASKAAAEKVLWKFRDEHKPHFTVTSINPSFVAGPPLATPSSADKISMSNQQIPDVYNGKPLDQAGVSAGVDAYVDVRDVARLVVFGVEHADKADGERFLTAAYFSPGQAVADILRDAFPERAGIIQKGNPGQGYEPDYRFPKQLVFDGTKAVRFTGQDYIPWRQTVLDTVEKLKPVLV
ncbi:fb83974c-ddb9-48a4-a33d-28eb76c8fc16 [Thermothielavioides terrestris]|uniref:Fb83974c-ddb9-48a4-a33d-28eb76c8fc16 n=1 Tax=Thermothielavioides terrestris TaxID=2587410 RepID=A0A446BE12_9PEZI|nr:fb83974c-ddb9-48a4-a33d-28eb76c8fc16 [Thermothielavioides terrestris]